MYKVSTQGVCAKEIIFTLDKNHIETVKFVGGCPGNAIGLSNMISGQPIVKVIEKLKDVKCGGKSTSCPAQLALALERFL